MNVKIKPGVWPELYAELSRLSKEDRVMRLVSLATQQLAIMGVHTEEITAREKSSPRPPSRAGMEESEKARPGDDAELVVLGVSSMVGGVDS